MNTLSERKEGEEENEENEDELTEGVNEKELG